MISRNEIRAARKIQATKKKKRRSMAPKEEVVVEKRRITTTPKVEIRKPATLAQALTEPGTVVARPETKSTTKFAGR